MKYAAPVFSTTSSVWGLTRARTERPARAGLSGFVPLLLLVLTGAWSAFGAFTSFYGFSARYAERTSRQISVAGILVGAVTLGCAVGLLHRQWWIVLVGALVAAGASLLSAAGHWHPPGPLSIVFAFTVCATVPSHPRNVVIGCAVALTVLFAIPDRLRRRT